MRVLVTGAGGYLGEAICRTLLNKGYQVKGLYRSSYNDSLASEPNMEFVRGNLLDPQSLVSAVEGCEQVYHVAAYANNWAKDPSIFYRVNIGGSLDLIKAGKKAGVKKFVITSSAGTIGPAPDHDSMASEEGYRHIQFFGDYESSKFILDEKVQQLVRKEGLDITIVCPTRIFGPGKIDGKTNMISGIFDKYRLGKWKFRLGNGEEKGCYAFIDDVVSGHLLAMEKGKAGEKYLIGSFNATFIEVLNEVGDYLGNRRKLLPIPYGVIGFAADILQGLSKWFKFDPVLTRDWVIKLQQNWYTDTSKAQKELGFKPTSKKEAIRKTMQWLENR